MNKMWQFRQDIIRKDLLWDRVIFFIVAHGLAIWGLYRLLTHERSMRLLIEVVLLWQVGGLGITAGAHRLWSHRSYEATVPFRVFLMLMNCMSNQGTIVHWSRDHRAHHKWTDTPADPHDTTRGFFYAHMGWLLVPKTEELRVKGRTIPCDDIINDPVVAFQSWAESKFKFMQLVCYVLPSVYAHRVYGDWLLGFLVLGVFRWLLSLHATWCVNSVAHFVGDALYDRNASPRESWLTSVLAVGEGWHSYHHKYPWDYATSEFGSDRQWNPSKLVIDAGAMLGLVTKVKRADHLARKARTQD
jgi:stearoyl-CoA desaturase (delta-9 desaturase)